MGKIAASTISDTDIGYLDGLISNIQNQINIKRNINDSYSTAQINGFSAIITTVLI